MTKIDAKIIKHSVDHRGNELITFELTYPRIIHAELLTHRMFSKNASSSRAVPSIKMIDVVEADNFCPEYIQKAHKGMQGSEYFEGSELEECKQLWMESANLAIVQARKMYEKGISKQIINRILEPYQYYKVLLTTGKEGLWNFFSLRCPEYQLPDSTTSFKSWKELTKNSFSVIEATGLNSISVIERLKLNKGQAEIHMMELAESMYDTYNESVPQRLSESEYHIPYDEELIEQMNQENRCIHNQSFIDTLIKASIGKCARTSYLVVGDDKSPSIETLVGIYEKTVNAIPKHSSPMEHIGQVATNEEYRLSIRGNLQSVGCETERYDDGSYSEDVVVPENSQGWFYNFRGFKSYRYILEQAN
jgi:thymidylate synthase ThyX